ncbi:MAG: class I SAM-dependent rRNA methyltransferase [Spirosomataceae bacterium]
MSSFPQIVLKPNRDEAVRRFHPWVFSGAIARVKGQPDDGEIVEVCDHRGNYLATGHFHHGNIAVKLFSFEQTVPNVAFWKQKLQKARTVRQQILKPKEAFVTHHSAFDIQSDTNCYRLVHGEGDGLPGLIIDFYNGVLVIQAHSIGMYRVLENLSQALQEVYGDELKAIYNKSAETLPEQFAQSVTNGYVFGQATVPHPVQENGHTFLIDWETGQKTGFFLDQRDNRQLLARYAAGKTVLNAFCYSGGFSIYALEAGAASVDSVDASKKAIELTDRNVLANFEAGAPHRSYAEDVMKFLKETTGTYDLMVLDPPAYAKSLSARHRAVQGYKRLNTEGIRHLKPNSILFTFSCSQVVDRELFYNTIVAAAIEAGRQVRVLHQITQPPDHPVNLFHPEGSYLKGLVLWVE